MRAWNVGFKGVCLAAVVALLSACETTAEKDVSASSSGTASTQGQAPQVPPAAVSSAQMKGPTPGSQEELDVAIGSLIYFDFDKYDLKPEARAAVERWAGWLEQHPSVTVTVEGHADERGTREYNLGLGERRATSARNYLMALGVVGDRIGIISYGKERPVCGTSNESCWSQNRRDHLIVN